MENKGHSDIEKFTLNLLAEDCNYTELQIYNYLKDLTDGFNYEKIKIIIREIKLYYSVFMEEWEETLKMEYIKSNENPPMIEVKDFELNKTFEVFDINRAIANKYPFRRAKYYYAISILEKKEIEGLVLNHLNIYRYIDCITQHITQFCFTAIGAIQVYYTPDGESYCPKGVGVDKGDLSNALGGYLTASFWILLGKVLTWIKENEHNQYNEKIKNICFNYYRIKESLETLLQNRYRSVYTYGLTPKSRVIATTLLNKLYEYEILINEISATLKPQQPNVLENRETRPEGRKMTLEEVFERYPELDQYNAKAIFAKAINLGYMDTTGQGLQWNSSNVQLAYIVAKIYHKQKYSYRPIKQIEECFNIKSFGGSVEQAENYLGSETQLKSIKVEQWINKINKDLFSR